MQSIQLRLVLILVCGFLTIKSADITLLVKKLDKNFALKCVATGTETLNYGMTWIFNDVREYDITSKASEYIGLREISKFNEHLELSPDVKHYAKSSLLDNLPPVLDHRWEGTTDTAVFNEAVYVINISILLMNNEPIPTLKLHTSTGSYHVKVSHLNKAQFCMANITLNDEEEKTIRIDTIGKWHHYTIYFTEDNFNLEKIGQSDNGYKHALNKFYINQLEIKGLNQVIWKLHKYEFLEIPKSETIVSTFVSKIRNFNKERICISFYLFTEQSCNVTVAICTNSTLEGCVSKEFSTAGEWNEFKIIEVPKMQYDSKFVHFCTKKSKNCFAALDDIRHCDINETRMLSLNHTNNNVQCVSLLNQEAAVYYKTPTNSNELIQNLENIGGANNISCEKLQQGNYCNKNIICNLEGCHCSPGYWGKYCRQDCSNKYWGINCENHCTCLESCDPHVGCKICMNGNVGSTCNNPKIDAEFKSVTATSVLFSMTGTENYNITKTKCKTSGSNETKDNSDSNDNKIILLYGLIPNTNYNLSCKFCFHDDCTEYKDLGEFKTKKCVDLTENNIRYNSTTDSIILNITELNFNHCPANLYEVFLDGNKTKDLQNLTIITNLEEFTQYKIEVRPKQILTEMNRHIQLNVTTDYKEPGKVQDFSRLNGSCFKADPPYINRNITSYSFQFQVKSNPNCNASNLTTDIITKNVNSEVICVDLIPYRKYEVKIKANNNRGSSRIPCARQITTYPIEEIKDDEAFIKISIVNKTIDVVFPHCNITRGPLFYHVQSACLEKWCNYTRSNLEVLQYADYKAFTNYIQSLTPFARHNITIHISRKNNRVGGRFVNLDITTPPTSPNNVDDLALYSYEDNKMFIRWKPPYPPTGQIKLYKIYYCTNITCYSTIIYKDCVLWDYYTCAELNDCEEGQEYEITVSAKNEYVNKRSFYSIMTKVEEMGSESPKYFIATNTSNCDIELEWSHPFFTYGRIRYFNVTRIETKSNISVSEKITQEGNVKRLYKYRLTNLRSIEYNIYIQAYNKYEGDKSEILTVTPCLKNGEVSRSLAFEWFRIVCISTAVVIIICVIILVNIQFRRKSLSVESKCRVIEELSLVQRDNDIIIQKNTYCQLMKRLVCNNMYIDLLAEEYKEVWDKMNIWYEVIFPNQFCSVAEKEEMHLNAHFIQGWRGENTYIATQCPRGNYSVELFWNTVWDKNITIIVSLLTKDEAKLEMNKYWSDGVYKGTEETIEVRTGLSEFRTDFAIRKFFLIKDGQEREVRHFNFYSFPFDDFPSYPTSFINFLKYIKGIDITNTPILVHCSDGFGRTGVFIMCYNFMRCKEGIVNIQKYLLEIRKCRPMLLNVFEQYQYVYYVLHQIFDDYHSSISTNTFLGYDDDSINLKIESDFNYLSRNEYTYKMYRGKRKMPNEIKAAAVPGYENQCTFFAVPKIENKDTSRFWKYIMSKRIKMIIVLQNIDEIDNRFWPSFGSSCSFDGILIQSRDHYKLNNIEMYRLNVLQNNQKEKTITLLYYKQWNCNGCTPQCEKDFYSLLKCYYATKVAEKDTILCCKDGLVGCGLFICADLILQKIKTENTFDLIWAIQGLKLIDNNFMKHMDQYRFLYALVKYYLDIVENEDGYHTYTSVTQTTPSADATTTYDILV